jgi:A/G-specific adenine glycosylase
MLGGLWEFPVGSIADEQTPAEAAAALLRQFGALGPPALVGGVAHVYSHFRLDLHLFHTPGADALHLAEGQESRWLSAGELADFPLHGAHKKALPLIPAR